VDEMLDGGESRLIEEEIHAHEVEIDNLRRKQELAKIREERIKKRGS
jgi:hypothetical protein